MVEGIDTADDLAEFDKTSIEAVAHNLRRPAAGNPLVFGAKSQKRLIIACDLVRFYETVGRPLTVANLQWNTVMKNFEIQYSAIKEKKKEDAPDTPKITKGLNVMKWSESFQDYLFRCIGSRLIPLAYVIRGEEVVDPVLPNLEIGQPHSSVYGSVEAELIARASHGHPLFRDDNAAVYFKMEEATRGTSFAASIKPFQRAKNGRGAYLAIVSQHAGDDKWNAEITKQDSLLHNQKWKGNGSFALERHCNQHRNAYVQMEAAGTHVPYQLPNGHTRVGYLLDSIETSDAELQASMASIRQDRSIDGLRNDFEKAVALLLPADPVAKKAAATGVKRGNANISGSEGAEATKVTISGVKSGRGSETGVHLRYYTLSEYKNLPNDQKNELRAWRATSDGKASIAQGRSMRKKPKGSPTDGKSIAAVVEKKVKEKLLALEKEKSDETDVEAYVMSVLHKFAEGKIPASSPKTPATAQAGAASAGTSFLRSILKKSKN